MYISSMNRVTTIRAIITPMPGASEAKLHAAAEKAGATVFYTTEQRSAWIRSLRPGQAGWCWRLSWLAKPMSKIGPRPIADYAHVVADLSRRIGEGAQVFVGDGKIDSENREAWLRAVFDGALQVRSGRVLTAREAARRGLKGAAVSEERSALNLLRTTHKHKLGIIRGLWRSLEYPNREARAEAINLELEASGLLRLGSWQTIWRALKKLEAK